MAVEGSDEVTLKLIFANDDATNELVVSLTSQVRDVKRKILEERWPQSLPEVETVDRLRLFAGGKELGGKDLEDGKTLKDTKILVSSNFPTPVHVQAIIKSAEPAAEKETAKPNQCFCAIL
eukprot:TRINITY_DN75257_c0_g1_i1.p1 TRINITY_DN75257_c0_g1~~TRINITY_DN75257_c0_g1_i1.p1  ORF type:complete len:121 (+),score=26.95 TRINITY_DN75257_c0_g1_i1:273-635(+)